MDADEYEYYEEGEESEEEQEQSAMIDDASENIIYADDESMTPSGTPFGDDISDATSISYQRRLDNDPYYVNKV